MGGIDEEYGVIAELHSEKLWLVLFIARGDPARYQGISIEMPTAAHTWSVPAALVAAAFASTTAFAALITSHAAPDDGPFAGVSGSTWWGSLSSTEKTQLRDYVIWLATRRPPI